MKFRNILLASAALLFCTASISAQMSHTWVSGSGSDAFACTFALPCLTFQAALANTNAGGIITAEDAGDFGPVTIAQSVTIDGNKRGSITFSAGYGIHITATANVTLRNLSINGLGSGLDGINVENGGIVIVDNCKIMNTSVEGVQFNGAGNLTVENSYMGSFTGTTGNYGIEIASGTAKNIVVKNTVIDVSPTSNGNVGFQIDPSTGPVKASLQNVTIMGAGDGAVNTATGVTEITNSVLTQSYFGVYAYGGSTISVASSLITSNTIGVCSNNNSKIRLDNNDIYDNTTAIDQCGGIVKTSTTNKTSGTISIPASEVSDSVTF
jgi:hypothetical protein